jgi:HD-GYP domain-containing protein (c-di-GMP phosphodiesterase class II)
MTNPNRKYKKKQKSVIKARDELIALSGKKYYPEIINAFKMIDLNLFEKKILSI